MENLTNIVCLPIIVSIVYAAMSLFKYTIKTNNSDKYEKWVRMIPVFSTLLGVFLGVICFYQAPDIICATNILQAILIGGASGLAATGTNQVFKQFHKEEKSDETEQSNKVD